MTTVTMQDNELEYVRREMMQSAITDMAHLTDEIAQLATVAPWPSGTLSSDAQSAARQVRQSLDVLDQLGWPHDEF